MLESDLLLAHQIQFEEDPIPGGQSATIAARDITGLADERGGKKEDLVWCTIINGWDKEIHHKC